MNKPSEEGLIIEGNNHCEEWEWEDLCDAITDAMDRCVDFIPDENHNRIFYPYHWYVEVRNFGWRNQNGYTKFYAEDGKTLLNEILPNTMCTFWLYKDGEYNLRLRNAHHDSPTGNENYCIAPCFDNDYLLFVLNGDGSFAIRKSEYFNDWALDSLLNEEHGISVEEAETEEDYRKILAELLSGEEYDVDFVEFETGNMVKLSFPFLPHQNYELKDAKKICKQIFNDEAVVFEPIKEEEK